MPLQALNGAIDPFTDARGETAYPVVPKARFITNREDPSHQVTDIDLPCPLVTLPQHDRRTLTGGRDVTPSETDVIPDVEELEEIRETKKRAENNTFSAIRIAPGSILTFSKDPSITCKVHGDKKVDLDGEVLSVSKSALRVLAKLGFSWSTVNGWAYWCYRGKTLSEYFLADEDKAA